MSLNKLESGSCGETPLYRPDITFPFELPHIDMMVRILEQNRMRIVLLGEKNYFESYPPEISMALNMLALGRNHRYASGVLHHALKKVFPEKNNSESESKNN